MLLVFILKSLNLIILKLKQGTYSTPATVVLALLAKD